MPPVALAHSAVSSSPGPADKPYGDVVGVFEAISSFKGVRVSADLPTVPSAPTDVRDTGTVWLGSAGRGQLRVVAVCSEAELAAIQRAIRNHASRFDLVHAVTEASGVAMVLPPLLLASGPSIADVVLLGRAALGDAQIQSDARQLEADGLEVLPMHTFLASRFRRIPVTGSEEELLPVTEPSPLATLGRRAFDILAALLVLGPTLMLMPLLWVSVRATSPGPVLFRQTRVGRDGRCFTLIKFRSMHMTAEANGPQFASANDPRVHSLGRWLRKTRVDELPQAINVLRGHMSVLGPRPERPEFTEIFDEAIPNYDLRHRVRPGLTGWAQVTEGYGAGVEDTLHKVERDLYYVRHRNFRLDLEILLRTVHAVFSGAGR